MTAMNEKRNFTRDQIHKLLDERQEMLVLFCQVAGLDPYQSGNPLDQDIKAFCQKMIDYIAAGHFAIYDRLLNGGERRKQVLDIAAKVYASIEDTTDIAVAFNDKYDEQDHSLDFTNLQNDLAMLGEAMSNRADYEDQLIDSLLH
ncbi:MAG: Rsd/AlgQ family anti-sigma factor [Arenicellales bacterium]